MAVNIGDVTFSFADACNCCTGCRCMNRRVPDSKEVYVNSSYEVEYFRVRKAADDFIGAMNRSIIHLTEGIENRAGLLRKNIKIVEGLVKPIFDEISEKGVIYMSHIRLINETLASLKSEVK